MVYDAYPLAQQFRVQYVTQESRSAVDMLISWLAFEIRVSAAAGRRPSSAFRVVCFKNSFALQRSAKGARYAVASGVLYPKKNRARSEDPVLAMRIGYSPSCTRLRPPLRAAARHGGTPRPGLGRLPR